MLSFQSVFLFFTYLIFWLILSYFLISVLEYLIHKHFMHRKRFWKWVYRVSPYILDVFEAHAVRHHAKWYRKFNYEPDPVGREDNLDILLIDTFAILLLVVPVWGTIMWIDIGGGMIFVATVFVHRYLWNTIHRQMHIPIDIYFRHWTVFRFLSRHHFMHHQRVDKNFNVVFPGTDILLGSTGVPKLKDVREMLRLGHLVPRSKRTQEILRKQGFPKLNANC